MSFLSEKEFLDYFPPIKMTRDQFARKFRVTYRNNPTLDTLLDRNVILAGRSVVKSLDDQRYKNRDRVIDYFYDVIIVNRHKYLKQFYKSYFQFPDPYKLKWSVNPRVRERSFEHGELDEFNDPDTVPERREEIYGDWAATGLETVSVQRNDAMRILIRNLNYLDILHTTRITNTSKCRVSFWQTFLSVYNDLSLEDRFFAPSSIGLYLREKKGQAINYNNFFYLFQAYQPKASVLNPFTIYWILENYFGGSRLFTPVLSWSSYLSAFFHSEYQHYTGVDVIPEVCERSRFLAKYYNKIKPATRNRKVDIWCQPSESLLKDRKFLKQYTGFFDSVLWCPPYYDMEIYQGGDQSIETFPDYAHWLVGYFEATVKLCDKVTENGAIIGIIMNDYYTLDGKYYPLISDFNQIAVNYFELFQIVELVNRVSPLRVNKKSRTEKLFLYRKR